MHIKLLFFKVCSNVRHTSLSYHVSVFQRHYPLLKQAGSDQQFQLISFLIFYLPSPQKYIVCCHKHRCKLVTFLSGLRHDLTDALCFVSVVRLILTKAL